MSTFKKCQVVMLLTEKAIIGCISNQVTIGKYFNIVDKYHLIVNPKLNPTYKYYHLYIVSNEEIKEGDWCHEEETNSIFKSKEFTKSGLVRSSNETYVLDACKKIIATTDGSLMLDYHNFATDDISKQCYPLPQPSQAFIEKYIKEYNKGNIITDILVEYHFIGGINGMFKSKELLIKDNNIITIHPIKTSWTREEVEKLCRKAVRDNCNLPISQQPYSFKEVKELENKWIEENL